MSPRTLFCFAAVMVLAAGPQPCGTGRFDALGERIRTAIEEEGVPSLAVAVGSHGRIVWAEGFGWADRERRVPATPDTRYSIASISKPITATGLMVLVERGLIDLDRPVNDYLGDAAVAARVGSAADATVRRIANHSSGLPLHHHFFYEDDLEDGRPRRPPPMEETIRRYGVLMMPPGERYQYSNLGYGILDHIIARLSGRTYGDFLRDEVFEPLGMRRTSVGIPEDERHDFAVRYGDDGAPLPFYDFDHRGASAVFSSARDLVRFGLFHLKRPLPETPPILSPRVLDEMQRPTADTSDGGYGIGWILRQQGGLTTASHSGGMGGVSTILTLVPERGLVVAVLANASTTLPQRVTHEIIVDFAPRRPWLPAGQTAGGGQARATVRPRAFRPDRRLRGIWIGAVHTYAGELPVKLWLDDSGEAHIQIGRAPRTPLVGATYREGYLRGLAHGDFGAAGLIGAPRGIQILVTLRGEALNGSLATLSRSPGRVGSALSYWVELERSE